MQALQEALARFGKPGIFNTDQGAQFTAPAFTDVLRERGIAISMDGRGRCLDNVFVERLWRSLKYEEVYLHVYDTVAEARAGIGRYFAFYNDERPHQALGYQTPRPSSTARPRPRDARARRPQPRPQVISLPPRAPPSPGAPPALWSLWMTEGPPVRRKRDYQLYYIMREKNRSRPYLNCRP